MHKIFLTLILIIFTGVNLSAQDINLDDYEIYVGDTLISKSDFIEFNQNLSPEKLKKLEYKPITNGYKKAYYLNGKLYSKGKIENLKENGFWEYWHPNGKKAREGKFVEGKPNGTHKYWYENGNLRGIGNWKSGVYEGKWEMYNEDGTNKIVQVYKEGKQIQ